MEKATATHSSTLAWKTPWMEESGRLWSMGSLRVRHQTRLSDFTFTFHLHALEKEMVTPSSVLAWRIPGMEKHGGLLSMGSHRVRHDWSDLTAMTTNEKSFMYLSVPCISSSVKCLFKYFGHFFPSYILAIFFDWFFVLFYLYIFLIWNIGSIFYMFCIWLYIWFWWQTYFTNIWLQQIACLFILLKVSFEEQNL